MGNCWNSNQGSLQRHASTWPPCTPIPHSSLLHAPSATSFQQISQNCIYLFPFLCPWLPYTHPDGYKREQWGCSMWLGLVLWIQHSCLSSSLFLKLKPWTVASANHAWLSRARNTRTNRVKTFRCSCKPSRVRGGTCQLIISRPWIHLRFSPKYRQMPYINILTLVFKNRRELWLSLLNEGILRLF